MIELTTEQKANLKRLAEAMRAGAAIRPQAFGLLFTRQVGVVCSCALGAAYEGISPEFDAEAWVSERDARKLGAFDIAAEFELLGVRIPNPWKPQRSPTLLSTTIIMLNDEAQWSREAIADWLLTLADDGRNHELDRYFNMKMSEWPDSLRASMNNVKPGSGDGIAETIDAWIKAGKVELDSNLQPKK